MKTFLKFCLVFVLGTFAGCEKDSGTKPVSDSWSYLASKDGLVNNNIRCIRHSGSHTWIGTEFGFSSYNGSTFKNYNTPQGLIHHQINGLTVSEDGIVWLATPYGLSVFSGNQFVNYDAQSGLSYDYLYSIALDENQNPWIATGKGVSYFDGSSWQIYQKDQGNSLVYNIVRDVEIDRQGNKWFGTEYGISRFDGNNWHTYLADLPLADFVLDLYVDSKQRIWVGSLAGVSMIVNDAFTDYNTSDGLVYNRVDAITEDLDGNMWFATQYGASRYDGTAWKTYNTANGLPEDWITSIEVDQDGNIWFGTKTKGLAILKRP